MYSKSITSAVAAMGLVSGAFAVQCTDQVANINSPGDAQTIGSCGAFNGSIVISSSFAGDCNFGGLKSVAGDLTALDNPNITSLSADSLSAIGGSLSLKNLIAMSTLSLRNLSSVDKIEWVTLRRLTQPTLGLTGITRASSILVADTTIKSLQGINVNNLAFLNLNNNKDIVTFQSNIRTVSDQIIVDANGLKMEMDMPNLIWASNMTISNVTTFSAPSLRAVNGSMNFGSNYFSSVTFPNLTTLEEGTFSFISNPNLQNLSMPALRSIGGGFIVANNTQLTDISGFPKLESVGGAVALRGSFQKFSFPVLDTVRGAAEIRSTEDIQAACDAFTKDKGSRIQGNVACTGKDSGANNNTGEGSSSGGSSGSGSSAGAFLGVNMATVFTLGGLGVFYTAFL